MLWKFKRAKKGETSIHVDRTPIHNTHQCRTVCSQARNAQTTRLVLVITDCISWTACVRDSKLSETSYIQSKMHFDDSCFGELQKMLFSPSNVQKMSGKPDAMVVKLHLCFEPSAIHQSCFQRDNVRAFRHKTLTLRQTMNISSQFERNPFASSEHTPREACYDQV